jgi:hypothetical protein
LGMLARRCSLVLAVLAISVAATLITARAGSDKQKGSRKDLEKRLKALRSVPYTSVTKDEADPGTSGVVVYKPSKSYRGYNIYCSTLTGEVVLIDMTGTVVQRWTYPDRQYRVWDHAVT